MADFSELCPIFSTGVFDEVVFTDINMSGVSVCANALLGTIQAATKSGAYTFGRTVVVTGAFLRRYSGTVEGLTTIRLMHHTSQLAAGTEFASITVSVTGDAVGPHTWMPFTVTEKTFTSSEVLGMTIATATTQSAGAYHLIVRYKEK